MFLKIFYSEFEYIYIYLPALCFLLPILLSAITKQKHLKHIGIGGVFAHIFSNDEFNVSTSLTVFQSIVILNTVIMTISLVETKSKFIESNNKRVSKNNVFTFVESASFFWVMLFITLMHVTSMLYHGFSLQNTFESRIDAASGGAYYFRLPFVVFNTLFGWVVWRNLFFGQKNIRNIALWVIIIVGALFTSSRGALLYPLIVMVLKLKFGRTKTIKILFGLLGLPVILFLTFWLGEFRNRSQAGLNVDIGDIELAGTIDAMGVFFSRLCLRISSCDDLMNFVPFAFDLIDPTRWFLTIIQQPIPRAIFPEKLQLFETFASQYSAPEIYAIGGSESVGMIGESYVTAGYLGPLIYGVILYFAVKYYQKIIGVFDSEGQLGGAFVMMLPYQSFTSGLLFSSLTIQLIFIFIFFKAYSIAESVFKNKLKVVSK
jgi:hypothetical protein